MSISTSIHNALSGLTANGRLADVASNNLANALTEGYGRQSVQLGSAALGGRGIGVQVLGVNRAAAADITAARRVADGEAATLGPQAEALSRLGRAFGEAGANEGLFNRIQDVETALRAFADSPASEPRQTQVLEAVKDLSGFLANLSVEAATVRENADKQIFAHVQTVNRNLDQIDALNDKIVRLGAGGRDVATLVDERERLIDEVSALIPARVHPQENGSMHITTTEGMYLLAETPQKLQYTQTSIITPPMRYVPGGGGALSGVTLNGFDITPGSGNSLAISEGAIAGNFIVRDDIGVEFSNQLDELAADLIQRFESPAVDPTLAAGDPGLFTDDGNAFDPLLVDGLARRLTVNPLVDPDAGGDLTRLRDGLQAVGQGPSNSDAVARALTDAFVAPRVTTSVPGIDGSLSAAEIVSSIAEAIGVRRANADTNLASLNTTRTAIANSEAEQIGVDTDIELQSLIQIEQAFSANIQVIQAASRMLDEIMEIR